MREWQEEAEGKGKKQVQKARAEGQGGRSGPCHLARKSTKKISEDQVPVLCRDFRVLTSAPPKIRRICLDYAQFFGAAPNLNPVALTFCP